jgi:hypothetical protein
MFPVGLKLLKKSQRIKLLPERLLCGMTDWFERIDEPSDPAPPEDTKKEEPS